MPRHHSSTYSFIIVGKGRARVRFLEKEEVLEHGATLHIPAYEPHSLQVMEDFAAHVVLAAEAKIQFNNL